MMKGKYTARAANREAARDNELLAEKLAEIQSLLTQIAELQTQLVDEKTSRDAIILARANKLSLDQINIAKRQLDEECATHQADKTQIAEILDRELGDEEGIPPNWYWAEVLPLLIPDLAERNVHMARQDERHFEAGMPRRVRRQGAQRIARSYRRRIGSDDLIGRLKDVAYERDDSRPRHAPLEFKALEDFDEETKA